MRHLMGVEKGFGYDRVEFEYQNIYDNVSILSDELVAEINQGNPGLWLWSGV